MAEAHLLERKLAGEAMCLPPAIALHIDEARSTIHHKFPVVLSRYAFGVCAIVG
jgi:hypothetical protein